MKITKMSGVSRLTIFHVEKSQAVSKTNYSPSHNVVHNVVFIPLQLHVSFSNEGKFACDIIGKRENKVAQLISSNESNERYNPRTVNLEGCRPTLNLSIL